MKKILGLDLGTNSIGWALIKTDGNNNPSQILGMGSRIIPMTTDDADEFTKGNAISKNQKRTEKRTQRKGYDRYQLRRQNLTNKLKELGMLPDETLIKLPILELWQLRANAATNQKISLPELGRVLYHLNQKRGYKHAKADEANEDKKQKDYVEKINSRYNEIKERNQTIAQYFVEKLKENEIKKDNKVFYTYRIKEQVFPRQAYIAEFDQIMNAQKTFYPNILTDENINKIQNEIIYYQRSLKSCKHLVSICEFEKKAYKNKNGKVVFDGPKVTPRTSPLFQVCKIWESINNLKLKNRKGDELFISIEQKHKIFEHLDNNEKLTLNDLYKIINITKQDGWWGGKAIGKGIQGNTTKILLKKALSNIGNAEELLKFNLKNNDTKSVDETTGEIIQIVSSDFQNEPLYKLWHTVYSITNKNELANALNKKFNINDTQTIQNLYALDFVKPGFGNKSAKAIRRILPYLQEGLMYSEACEYAGFRHSESLTNEENEARELLNKIPQIQKNELKQPIVEKILNQMINIVNAVIDEHGTIDEIRVELARELKQSKDERNATDRNIRQRERENKNIATIIEEYGIRPSRNRIQKYRMWEESEHKCFYCGKPINVKEFLEGFDVEIEHIIPKSLLFDDSFANKACACRECNQEKGNKTAYDYMQTKSEDVFEDYLNRVKKYFEDGKISKTKRERLLTPKDKIPNDFIDRQLRQSQYIARKSTEILKQISRNVYTTTGSVTDFIRHAWGYDEILHNINLDRYRLANLTEIITKDHKGQTHEKERIKDWSKRLDHRHHAVDALTIACTKQSFIQRLNNLNTERDSMFAELEKQNEEIKEKFSLLEQWIKEQKHFSTSDVTNEIDKILVSFKAGKKVATVGKRKKYINGKKVILQDNIIIPRGALSEESVYGKIKTIEKQKPIKYIFENPDLIVKDYIKKLVKERIENFEGDIKKAINSLKKEPIFLDKDQKITLEYATCYKNEYVIKYPITNLKAKDTKDIIDNNIKQAIEKRLKEFNNNEKEAFKDLANNPIYADKNSKIPIKTVRCFTGLSAVEPVKYNEQNQPIGFVKPGNNHHIAIYIDHNENKQEHTVTFWHAVERKKYGIPTIITNPSDVWDNLLNKNIPETFLKNLPDANWTYENSLQQNEMFILGMTEEEFQNAINNKDYNTLNKFLYRVQKIGKSDYTFRYHIETQIDTSIEAKAINKFYRINSIDAFYKLNPHKVQISLLGKIKIL